jgi:hypothetical protein
MNDEWTKRGYFLYGELAEQAGWTGVELAQHQGLCSRGNDIAPPRGACGQA